MIISAHSSLLIYFDLGAIVGIVIAIPAVLIIIGAVVFFCRNKQPGE